MDNANSKLCDQIVALLLDTYFTNVGQDRMQAGSLSSGPQVGCERILDFTDRIFLNPSGLIAPALLLRCKGPTYLSLAPLNSIKEKLRRFFDDNYHHIRNEVGTENFNGALSSVVSQHAKHALVKALEESNIFEPKQVVNCFPLTPVRVEKNFHCDLFYLIDLASLTTGDPAEFLRNRTPISDTHNIKAWLGVRAPSIDFANRVKRIVLGALALSIIHRERHAFTLRSVSQNYLTLDGQVVSTSSNTAHTPPLGSDILIGANEHFWLRKLARLIPSTAKDDRRKCKALEYYYRAWFMDDSDRCPFMFMVLDAIFGQGSGPTAVKLRTGINSTLKIALDEERFDLLIEIRGALLHGGSPNIFESSKYLKYCNKYNVDPVYDLDLLTAKCLRYFIFEEDYKPQLDPYAALLSDSKFKGILAETQPETSIVKEWP